MTALLPDVGSLRVLTCVLRHDYGDPKRGESPEVQFFVRNLERVSEHVTSFWYDDFFGDMADMNRRLEETVLEARPDIVFFAPFKTQVEPETLARIRETATTVAWFADDQWRFDGYSREYSRHFDLVVTTDPWSVDRYRADGRRVLLSQWAADTNTKGPIEDDAEFRHDVTFVGQRTPHRDWFVKHLRKQGVPVECFGKGWKGRRISFAEMGEIFRTSRINLNLSNSVNYDIRQVFHSPKALAMTALHPKNVEQIKGRHFEIPGVGGFQLSYYVSALERYLRPGDEIAVFDSPGDCARQVTHFLGAPAERLAIARAGFERVQREHTWVRRMADILEAAARA
jgi:spore maturation protein CgeB